MHELDNKLQEIYTSISDCIAPHGCLRGEVDFENAMAKETKEEVLRKLWTSWYNVHCTHTVARDCSKTQLKSATRVFHKPLKFVWALRNAHSVQCSLPSTPYVVAGCRHDQAGPPQRELYTRRVELFNKGARENGWPDAGYYDWYSDYEVAHFDRLLMSYWHEISPLYEQLHAYVRHRLLLAYPDAFGERDPIPVHLLRALLYSTRSLRVFTCSLMLRSTRPVLDERVNVQGTRGASSGTTCFRW